MKAQFELAGDDLYIDGEKVIRVWASTTGWLWFATEFVEVQDSDLGKGQVIKDDKIYFGFVHGFEDEWGNFSEGELMNESDWVREVPKGEWKEIVKLVQQE